MGNIKAMQDTTKKKPAELAEQTPHRSDRGAAVDDREDGDWVSCHDAALSGLGWLLDSLAAREQGRTIAPESRAAPLVALSADGDDLERFAVVAVVVVNGWLLAIGAKVCLNGSEIAARHGIFDGNRRVRAELPDSVEAVITAQGEFMKRKLDCAAAVNAAMRHAEGNVSSHLGALPCPCPVAGVGQTVAAVAHQAPLHIRAQRLAGNACFRLYVRAVFRGDTVLHPLTNHAVRLDVPAASVQFAHQCGLAPNGIDRLGDGV